MQELKQFMTVTDNGRHVRFQFDHMVSFLMEKLRVKFSPTRFEEEFLAEFNRMMANNVPFTEEQQEAVFRYMVHLAKYLANEWLELRMANPRKMVELQDKLRQKHGIDDDYIQQLRSKYNT